MEKQVSRLKDSQTELTAGTPWRLEAWRRRSRRPSAGDGKSPAPPAPGLPRPVHHRSGAAAKRRPGSDNGAQRRWKSSLLRLLWRQMQQPAGEAGLRLHPRLHPGYYDQTLHQLADEASLRGAGAP